MAIQDLSDASVLKLYENIRLRVAADLRLGSRHRLLGETAKREALCLESFVKNWSPAPGSSGVSSRDGLEEGSDDDTQELCEPSQQQAEV
ncbi:hypothetical protein GPL17_27020, partial [Bradyrhizobium yuanmingense]|nr:hypothetical protein [Bradyrhizobium yuanmingense]